MALTPRTIARYPAGALRPNGASDAELAAVVAAQAFVRRDSLIQLAFTTGTSTDYITTADVAGRGTLLSIPPHQKFLVRFHVACGADPIITIDGFDYAMKDERGNDIAAGDIKDAQPYILYFNGAYISVVNRYPSPEELANETAARLDGDAALALSKISTSEKGATNGITPLVGGKVPLAYMDPTLTTGGRTPKGVWNASTNSPSIPAAAVGNAGWFYIVNVAGSTSIDGISSWAVNDTIMSNGTAWEKIPFSTGTFASNGDIDAGIATDKPLHAAGVARAIDNFAYSPPQGRLTPLSGIPVLSTNNVLNATTIYYVPFVGKYVPVWNGTRFVRLDIGTQISLALDSASGHTGYHATGRIFDLFVILQGGVPRLASGPAWSGTAWSDDQVRAGAIDRVNGLLTNTSSMTMRYGASSGDTVSVAAGFGTYVGTFMASADGETAISIVPGPVSGGTDNKLFIWNMYNRVDHHSIVRELDASWPYTVNTRVKVNSSDGNKISVVCGFAEDSIHAFMAIASSNTVANVMRRTSIGFVTNSNTSVETWATSPAGIIFSNITVMYRRPNNAGYNTVFGLIRSEAIGVTTWFGAGDQEFRISFLM